MNAGKRQPIRHDQASDAIAHLARRIDKPGWPDDNLVPGADYDRARSELQQITGAPESCDVNDWIDTWLTKTGRDRLFAFLRQTRHIRNTQQTKITVKRPSAHRFSAWAAHQGLTHSCALEKLVDMAERQEAPEEEAAKTDEDG